MAKIRRLTLPVLFIAAFALTMWMALYVPIYVDEPAWKLIGARLFVDSGKLIYFFPVCSTGFWLDVPVSWLPTRLIDSVLYQDPTNPFKLRLFGWTAFLSLLTAWTYMLRRISSLSTAVCGLLVTCFFSVGVLPFLLVFNRPEQAILIYLTACLLLLIKYDNDEVTGRWKRSALTCGLGLLACLLAGSHPKGLFFFPVVLIVFWRLVRSIPLAVPLVVVMLKVAVDTAGIWSSRTACPESPWLTAVLQSLSLQPQTFFKDPAKFIDLGLTNVTNSYAYVDSIKFQQQYQSDWLPAAVAGSDSFVTTVVMNSLVYMPIIIALLMATWGLVRQLLEGSFRWAVVTGGLTLSLLALIFFQSNKNFYEAALVWPVVLVVFVISFAGHGDFRTKLTNRIIFPTLLIIGLLNAVWLQHMFLEHALTWRTAQNNPVTVPDWLPAFVNDTCGINSSSDNLLLDNSTYLSYWKTPRPIFVPYVYGWWATQTDYIDTLRKSGLGGAVVSCDGMPPDLAPAMSRRGGYCCSSKDRIRRFLDNYKSLK
jgi:hypothetical protein